MTPSANMDSSTVGERPFREPDGGVLTVGEDKKERSDVRKMLLKTLRPLPLMHNWTFWYDR